MNDISEYLTAFCQTGQVFADTFCVPGLPPGQGLASVGHTVAVVWGSVMPPHLHPVSFCLDGLAKPGARPETVLTGSEAAAAVSCEQS